MTRRSDHIATRFGAYSVSRVSYPGVSYHCFVPKACGSFLTLVVLPIRTHLLLGDQICINMCDLTNIIHITNYNDVIMYRAVDR